jgi:hypothetical protein
LSGAAFEALLARRGVAALSEEERAALNVDGYIVLRGVHDEAECEGLRTLFERTYLPSDQWPAPRSAGVRHAMLDNEPQSWEAALKPRILACAQHFLRRPFYLFDVQGRDPRPGKGAQALHRDWVAPAEASPMVIALAFFDPFGPANGATRVVPGSHRMEGGPDIFAHMEHHPQEVTIEGAPGDVLVCDGHLVHSATANVSGAHRRNLQISFYARDVGQAPTRDCGGASDDLRTLLGV